MKQKNAGASESQEKEFTSLLGSQMKQLRNGLPLKLGEVLYPDTCKQCSKSALILSICIIRFLILICPKLLQMQCLYRPKHGLSCFAH